VRKPGQQLLTGVDGGRVEPGRIHLRQGPFDDPNLLWGDPPGPLHRAQVRPHGLQRLTGHRHPLRQRLGGMDPPGRLTRDSRSIAASIRCGVA
jgi:hypothetical protein